MAESAPGAIGDPTDPQGTLRPDEPPAQTAPQAVFRPLSIEKRPGGPRLPADLALGDINALIGLFLTSELLEVIAEHTNAYSWGQTSQALQNFALVSPSELQTWLGVHIYMTTAGEARQRDYWRQDLEKGPLYPLIIDAMGRDRWKAIAGALHVTAPGQQTSNVFEKVRLRLPSRLPRGSGANSA